MLTIAHTSPGCQGTLATNACTHLLKSIQKHSVCNIQTGRSIGLVHVLKKYANTFQMQFSELSKIYSFTFHQ